MKSHRKKLKAGGSGAAASANSIRIRRKTDNRGAEGS
jgi:hypothetical protein